MSRVAALGMGLAAALGFLLVYGRLRCCEGEAGFSQNASTALLVAVGLFAAAAFAQSPWRGRVAIATASTLVLWSIAGAILVAARPAWDDYVFGRPLHLGWRALAVFGAVTAITYLLGSLIARRRPSGRTA